MLRIIVKVDDFEAYRNILKIIKGVGEKSAVNFINDISSLPLEKKSDLKS